MGLLHGQGRINRPENPYNEDTSHVRPYEPPEPAVTTLRDLDRLVAAKIADARREWAGETRRECADAWEQGNQHGTQRGMDLATQHLRDEIERVIRGQLNHIVRRLDSLQDSPKKTIAHDRARVSHEVRDIRKAIGDLEGLGS